MNSEVTKFLDGLNHPSRAEIEQLRQIILAADSRLTENIKWNGPNYCFNEDDRITMKIHPPRQVQLIFHRGAKKLEQPQNKIIADATGLLTWKENDRAIVSFKNLAQIESKSTDLATIVRQWIAATV